jgi:hypothetical protein
MSSPIDVASGVFAAVLFAVGWLALFDGLWVRSAVPAALGVALVSASLILLTREPRETS